MMPKEPRPPFSADDAIALARQLYGSEVRATELVGYDDRNFRLEDLGSGELSVLKIHRSRLDPLVLDAENRVLEYLRKRAPALPCPRLLPSLHQRHAEFVESPSGETGEQYLVRRLSWLEGRHLDAVHHSAELLGNIGATLANLDSSLEHAAHELDLEACERRHPWDLRRGPEAIGARIDALEDRQQRNRVESLVEQFIDRYASRLDSTRQSLIHSDPNEFNLLVSDPAEGLERFEPLEITGILDFGDLVVTHNVCDLAITYAYLLIYQAEPITALGPLVAGYHQHRPLDEDEIALVFPLALLRLCVSVTMAAHHRRIEPDNEYISISEQGAWRTLDRLRDVHPHRVEWLLRQACGLEPCPGSARVQNALEIAAAAGEIAPVLGFELDNENTHALDSSLSSPLFSSVVGLAPGAKDEPGRSTAVLTEATRASGKEIGWGRWNEARPFYGGEQFAGAGQPIRTVHLGVDLACDPGTPIHAPLDGVVHSVADNNHPGDYGPTLLLEHQLPAPLPESEATDAPREPLRFLTLYGHLERESIADLEPGQRIHRGEPLAAIGSPDENGGWWPHLHFQLIVDPLDYQGDFPGVAAPAERAAWLSVSPDPNLLLRNQDPVVTASDERVADEQQEILTRRRRSLSGSLSLSYRQPLQIVRGEGAWLFDSLGHRYLDLVNNVCHIGHCHPAVVEAVHRQMALLNTNTRYLHRNLVDYAERLAATLPDPLEVCFFVNSGSEANDLALRIARAVTGRTGVLCFEAAYHGNLSSLIDISPYKHDGPGGEGTPTGVTKAPLPDTYRGRHRSDQEKSSAAGQQYTHEIVRQIESLPEKPAAFFAESILGCGGQIVLPAGYLEGAFGAVRRGGGLCIADEVQVGFGRVGSHFWGFEAQAVVPDMVTLGKPIGNGHPIGAVVTTRKIADAFAASGMEYFNTFGGNPVSCAAGLAVLEVIEKEGLQQNALEVGAHMLAKLQELQVGHPCIGDVRGQGLFLGIEMIDPRAQVLTPDADLARFVVERMKQRGFLLSTDGPDHNVIKIKPPLVVGREDVARVVDEIGVVLDGVGM